MDEYDGSYHSVAVTSLPKIVSRKKPQPQQPQSENGKEIGTVTTNSIKKDSETITKQQQQSNYHHVDEATALLERKETIVTSASASTKDKNNKQSVNNNENGNVIVDLDNQSQEIIIADTDQISNDNKKQQTLDLIREHFIWTPLSERNTNDFDVFLEQRIKAAFKNDTKPREHQWKTIQSIVKDLAYPKYQSSFQNGKRYNYLIQHAAGSGKSMTIATLVYTLYKLEIEIRYDCYYE
ncbi:hypothetical protein PPL_02123 [Heterostelium album PN500]|uniref:Helicase/UvrB N-terminal domain-containing protein n=1 Tax=Heterostelium pallidum (strain ATCC 26659 / Pp 5 / PN500) TaxID=670386 RepID=D3B1F1_HETP5|nr:hypothetical protein PPL_02123 [Heterostelium album PN500]EFA85125.1 hypothetical protein PPL_02123 [Heterostelium album PN500]|eukprot:XP_020437234.1 hypothetical protein PPL_02123 [Heterostelium album PN500]